MWVESVDIYITLPSVKCKSIQIHVYSVQFVTCTMYFTDILFLHFLKMFSLYTLECVHNLVQRRPDVHVAVYTCTCTCTVNMLLMCTFHLKGNPVFFVSNFKCFLLGI